MTIKQFSDSFMAGVLDVDVTARKMKREILARRWCPFIALAWMENMEPYAAGRRLAETLPHKTNNKTTPASGRNQSGTLHRRDVSSSG